MTTKQLELAKAEEDKKTKKIVKTTFVSQNAGWKRLFTLYKPQCVIAVMVILAALNSLAMPVTARCIIVLQFIYFEQADGWEKETMIYLIIFACWVCFIMVVSATEKSIFGLMGEKLTFTLRLNLLEEIVHKQIAWFDREDRAPGIITNIISADIASLNGMTSEVLVTIFEVACICVIGMTAGSYFCWQAAILSFLLSPIMIIGMYKMVTMQFGAKGGKWAVAGEAKSELGDFDKANSLLSDLIINYRTIISLGQDNVDEINNKYERLCGGPLQQVLT